MATEKEASNTYAKHAYAYAVLQWLQIKLYVFKKFKIYYFHIYLHALNNKSVWRPKGEKWIFTAYIFQNDSECINEIIHL